jgi:hypothetical protein
MWANEESRQRILQRMNDQEVVANNSAKVTALIAINLDWLME